MHFAASRDIMCSSMDTTQPPDYLLLKPNSEWVQACDLVPGRYISHASYPHIGLVISTEKAGEGRWVTVLLKNSELSMSYAYADEFMSVLRI
jgi:hypothetical protein